jgi:ElaA protein
MRRNVTMIPHFLWAEFDRLTGRQVHDLLRLRQDFFVVEQNCPYPDIDGRDPMAEHLLAFDPTRKGGALVGTLRLLEGAVAPHGSSLPTLLSPEATTIGRIVVAPDYRGVKLGGLMLTEAIRQIETTRGAHVMQLSAQAHLQGFYGRFGFGAVGEEYLEDGIPHVDMRRPAAATESAA